MAGGLAPEQDEDSSRNRQHAYDHDHVRKTEAQHGYGATDNQINAEQEHAYVFRHQTLLHVDRRLLSIRIVIGLISIPPLTFANERRVMFRGSPSGSIGYHRERPPPGRRPRSLPT